jgi:hypothetical protein
MVHNMEHGVKKLIDMTEPTVEIPDRIATTKEEKISPLNKVQVLSGLKNIGGDLFS